MPLDDTVLRILASAGILSEARRPIRLRLFQENSVWDDVLLVKRIHGRETLCGGLEYRLLCLSGRADLPLKEFIALPAEVQFVTDQGELRSVCGIVSEAAAGQSDGGLASYRITIRDALTLMELRTNTRIFRQRNELDITRELIAEWRSINPILARTFDIDWRCVRGTYPAREFTMQHNESDAAFLRRLWKRQGIAWFIRPGPSSRTETRNPPEHALVLVDDALLLEQNVAGTVRYHRADGTEEYDTVTAWSPIRTLQPGSVARQSWDYLQGQPMEAEKFSIVDQGSAGTAFAAGLQNYLVDMPHAGDDGDDYRRLGDLRMKRFEYESKCFVGEGTGRSWRVGEWIRLSGHAEIDTHPPQEREFVFTDLEVDAENNLPKELDERARRLFASNGWSDYPRPQAECPPNPDDRLRYRNRFSCVRRGVPIVPAFDPRSDLPRPTLQSAIVVGPPGEEVHCDTYGRVKVRFPGARARTGTSGQETRIAENDQDSAWIRVASHWAGTAWGAITLPRVGDEVIVDFLGADPDKPIIVGRVFGGTALPPSFNGIGGLPGNRYVAGIKSKEVHGTRFNQLRLDDTAGQISAQLASEHAHSELNLGWLTHPRHDGKGLGRGDGAELRSDAAVAIRGGQGVLISADSRERASGRHLDRQELLGLMDLLQGLQDQLSQLANTHHAGNSDQEAFKHLIGHLKQWEANTNAERSAASSATSGKPIVAVSAPAGAALASAANIVIGAQTHLDMVSAGNTQVSSGRSLLMRASEGLRLFAHKLGIQLVAASGKIALQTHKDDIEATSARRIVLTAADEIVLQAPKLRFIAQGAQVGIGDGTIVQQSSGAHVIRSSSFAHTGPGSGKPAEMAIPTSSMQTDERFVIVRRGSGRAEANQRYRIELDDGRIVEGRTDAQGRTELTRDAAHRIAHVTLLRDTP